MMRTNMLVCASLLFIHHAVAAAAAAVQASPNHHHVPASQLHNAHAAMVAATKLLPADQASAERAIFE